MEDGAVSAVPFALFRRAVGELMVQYGPVSEAVKDRYADGRLDDIISEAMSQERVLYLAVPVTVPAGGEVNNLFAVEGAQLRLRLLRIGERGASGL